MSRILGSIFVAYHFMLVSIAMNNQISLLNALKNVSQISRNTLLLSPVEICLIPEKLFIKIFTNINMKYFVFPKGTTYYMKTEYLQKVTCICTDPL